MSNSNNCFTNYHKVVLAITHSVSTFDLRLQIKYIFNHLTLSWKLCFERKHLLTTKIPY